MGPLWGLFDPFYVLVELRLGSVGTFRTVSLRPSEKPRWAANYKAMPNDETGEEAPFIGVTGQ